jgi:hypothetical protein
MRNVLDCGDAALVAWGQSPVLLEMARKQDSFQVHDAFLEDLDDLLSFAADEPGTSWEVLDLPYPGYRRCIERVMAAPYTDKISFAAPPPPPKDWLAFYGFKTGTYFPPTWWNQQLSSISPEGCCSGPDCNAQRGPCFGEACTASKGWFCVGKGCKAGAGDGSAGGSSCYGDGCVSITGDCFGKACTPGAGGVAHAELPPALWKTALQHGMACGVTVMEGAEPMLKQCLDGAHLAHRAATGHSGGGGGSSSVGGGMVAVGIAAAGAAAFFGRARLQGAGASAQGAEETGTVEESKGILDDRSGSTGTYVPPEQYQVLPEDA